MEFIESFLGRLHPLLVHLPIGILILAFIFEVLALRKKYAYLKPAIQPSLFIGALAAFVSCITGYFLSLEGGYTEPLLTQHQYLGIVTATLSFLLFFLRRTKFVTNSTKKYIPIILFTPVILLVSLTGHFGGSLTHGEDFLSFSWSAPENEALVLKPISNIDSAILYADVVRPILKSKCYSCHSSKKQKGDLRLDEIDFIKRGGKDGEIIVTGLPDSSTLYKRLLLPLEDEHHMSPKGKPQPTSTEIAIINDWIEGGASFDKLVKDFAKADKLKSYIASLQNTVTPHWVPAQEVAAPDPKTIASLKLIGAHVLTVDQDSHYLMINFINVDSVSDENLNLLLPVKEQLVWLSLEGVSLSDKQLTIVAKLKNLRWLYLNNTEVSDQGISALNELPELQFINLVNTNLTDQGLQRLSNLKKLKKLFVYKTNLSKASIDSFKKILPHTSIDTGGYTLPRLDTDTLVFTRQE